MYLPYFKTDILMSRWLKSSLSFEQDPDDEDAVNHYENTPIQIY